jgi:hypothetical protein
LAVVLSSCNKGCEHTFSDEWSFDRYSHWRVATCEYSNEKGDVGDHYDEDNNGKCDACGFVIKGSSSGGDNATSKVVDYTVFVKDAEGNAVSGVRVILISDKGFYTSAKTTGEDGKVSFGFEEGSWHAAIEVAHPDFTNTPDERYELIDGSVTITMNK